MPACSGGDEPTDGGIADSGPKDSGTNNNNNNNTDAGVVDTGVVDTGVITEPCPTGTEGCGCTSNIGPNDTAFLQDNCEAGMVCVPFDLLTGRNDLTGPVQSCVKTCSTDADCGAGQTCAETGFGEASGAGSICMDRIAQYDEPCGFSRGLVSRVPDVELMTSGEIVGCAQGTECLIGVFGDIHPDEGLCLAFCQNDGECGGSTPYCNPKVFTSSSTVTPFIGVCSTGKYGQGGLCGSENPAKLGVASRCDSSDAAHPNMACFGTPDVPDGLGACIALCNTTDSACRPNGPSGLAQTCVPFPEIFDPGDDFSGLCSVECDNFPDNCAGDGAGVGQYCSGPFQFSQTGNSFSFCADRTTPSWVGATFNSQGMVVSQGDNCGGNATKCPEPGFCAGDGSGNGLCVVGCNTSTTAMTTACSTLLNSPTAVCLGGIFTEPAGLCGDN